MCNHKLERCKTDTIISIRWDSLGRMSVETCWARRGSMFEHVCLNVSLTSVQTIWTSLWTCSSQARSSKRFGHVCPSILNFWYLTFKIVYIFSIKFQTNLNFFHNLQQFSNKIYQPEINWEFKENHRQNTGTFFL